MKKIIYLSISVIFVLGIIFVCRRYMNSYDVPTADMTPVEVVELYFEGVRTKNVRKWLATLTEHKQAGFAGARSGESTLLSFEMHEIYQLTEGEEVERQRQALFENTPEEEIGGSAENIAFVYAEYTVEYDPTKNPFSGRRGWVYTLYRTDEASPWLISDWGVGHFSIAFTGD